MTIKRLLCPILVFAAVTRGLAAVPESLEGNVYYESTTTVGTGGLRASTSLAVVLNADGKFTALFFISGSNRQFATQTTVPGDGTYTYKKLDDKTATLTLSLPAEGGSTQRILNFTADDSGRLDSSNFILGTSGTFRVASVSARSPLSNCSNRSFVPAGGIAFSGFVVTGTARRFVLIRAVGQTLSAFGVTDGLRDPRLLVTSAAPNTITTSNDDWSSDSADALNRVGNFVGAFPLPANSKDAALIIELPAGAFIAQASSSNVTDAGEALIEVYMLP